MNSESEALRVYNARVLSTGLPRWLDWTAPLDKAVTFVGHCLLIPVVFVGGLLAGLLGLLMLLAVPLVFLALVVWSLGVLGGR